MSEDENIQRLRAIRGAHRGVATKLLNEADELLASTSPTTLEDELKTKLNILKQQIKCKLAKLNEVDEKILDLCDVKNIGAEVLESEEYTARVTSCIVRLESVVNKSEIQVINTAPTVETLHISSTQIRAKLPKITLQKFRGNVTNWNPFWESFKAAVHENNSISKVDKMNYLFSHLEGAAARSVQGLTLTEANYDAAIVILEERFGRPQQIIAAHMDELLKVQPCSNERSSSIRFVYDKIRVHVRGLEALGVTPEQYGSLLIPILMSFDTGSQRTYITNSLKSRLGLKPVEKESLRLNTFGDDRVRKETCDIVKLSLQKGDGERVDVAALSFPVICSSLPLKVEVNAYPHIEGLALADAFDDQDSTYQHLNSYQDQYPELIELIKKSLYVDDLLSGGSNDSQTFDIYKRSKEIMSEGGFNLRKWNSNSSTLLESINKCETHQDPLTQSEKKVTTEDESYTKSTIGPNNSNREKSVKVLGSNWNTHSDELFFDFENLITYAKSLPITKRALLKLTAKIFDPLGFLSPFTTRLKAMFQILCCDKIDWDEELHGDSRERFNSFVSDLQHLSNVRIPRCYFDVRSKPTNIQLHGFSDASQQAFAAVVYLRSTYEDGRVAVKFVASKTKVAPTKKQSIPRLELLGALILARLVATIKESLSLPLDTETFYWVDSITTLYWIQNVKSWKQYVEHRYANCQTRNSGDFVRVCKILRIYHPVV